MPWSIPPLPHGSQHSVVEYWLAVLDLPNDDPAAPVLHTMARQRLLELGVGDMSPSTEVELPAGH